jgi:hypothetical protein
MRDARNRSDGRNRQEDVTIARGENTVAVHVRHSAACSTRPCMQRPYAPKKSVLIDSRVLSYRRCCRLQIRRKPLMLGRAGASKRRSDQDDPRFIGRKDEENGQPGRDGQRSVGLLVNPCASASSSRMIRCVGGLDRPCDSACGRRCRSDGT